MRTRLAALALLAVLVLSGCSDEPVTSVTEEGVIETPTSDSGGGGGLDAPSGEPLVPDSSAEPGADLTSTPSAGS